MCDLYIDVVFELRRNWDDWRCISYSALYEIFDLIMLVLKILVRIFWKNLNTFACDSLMRSI